MSATLAATKKQNDNIIKALHPFGTFTDLAKNVGNTIAPEKSNQQKAEELVAELMGPGKDPMAALNLLKKESAMEQPKPVEVPKGGIFDVLSKFQMVQKGKATEDMFKEEKASNSTHAKNETKNSTAQKIANATKSEAKNATSAIKTQANKTTEKPKDAIKNASKNTTKAQASVKKVEKAAESIIKDVPKNISKAQNEKDSLKGEQVTVTKIKSEPV